MHATNPFRPRGLALIFMAALLGACGHAQPLSGSQTPGVTVVTVHRTNGPVTIELPGRTNPYYVAQVRARIDGIVIKRDYQEGTDVTAGQCLYQIDPAPYVASLNSARASLQKSQVKLVATRAQAARYKALVAAVSQQDYDNAVSSLGQAEADVESGKALVDSAQISLGYTAVVAPISGRASTSQVTDGAYAQASAATLMSTVQQIDPMYVDLTQSSVDGLQLRRDVASGSVKLNGPNQAPVKLVPEDGTEHGEPAEPAGIGAGIVLDEHLLTSGKRDEDYNGGGEVTFSGERGGPIGRVLDRALAFVDKETCPQQRCTAPGWRVDHALAVGLLIFTPQDLAASDVVYGDRPYASLFFLSAGRRYVAADADVAYNSSLTFGMLGLDAARSVQHALHSLTGSVQPQGWSHQISSGGEPTLRYSAARQALVGEFGQGTLHGDSKWTVAGSLGTVTEGSLAYSVRWGRIQSSWWAFTPEQTMYVQETHPIPPPLGRDAPPEIFVFAGARAKLRVYNAFLQGQFRHSDLTYGWGDVNPALAEVWAGLEFRTSSGWALQYQARWESPELRSGQGSRSFTWGSIQVSKTFH